MKQMMLDVMVAMMPYMMLVVYAGYASVATGTLAAVGGMVVPGLAQSGLALLAGRIAMLIGIFFIACQFAGMMLGATPAINFGDSTKFEFNLVPFWQIGAAFLVAGTLISYFTRRRSAAAT